MTNLKVQFHTFWDKNLLFCDSIISGKIMHLIYEELQ